MALRLAVCVISGTGLFLGTATFDLWLLPWFAMVPWLWVVLHKNTKSPFFYGWWVGLVGNSGGFYWIYRLLERFGDLPMPVRAALFFLFIGYQALHYGAFSWLLRHMVDRTGLPTLLLAPVVFTACELVIPTIFPFYLAITQAWVVPVIQIADITGPLGVSFVVVAVNAAIFDVTRAYAHSRRIAWRSLSGGAGILVATLAYGQVRITQVEAQRAAAPKINVGVVQANVGIRDKQSREFAAEALARHQRSSAELQRAGADLILWPETAYPYPLHRAQTGDFAEDRPGRIRRGFDVPLLFGALTVDPEKPESTLFNSAILLDADEFVARYDKNKLLVFGEYIPFVELLGWLREMVPTMAHYARGGGPEIMTLVLPKLGADNPVRLGPLICYEDIVPAYVNRVAALRPNLFVNLTNDAWFGATNEPWEHLQLAVFRAVEHRLDLVRAVNTGVSSFVDSTGRVYRHGPSVDPVLTPNIGATTLLETVAIQEPGGLYGAIGDLFGYLNLTATLVMLGWTSRRLRARAASWRAVPAPGSTALPKDPGGGAA